MGRAVVFVCLNIQGRPPPVFRNIKTTNPPTCPHCHMVYTPHDTIALASFIQNTATLPLATAWLCKQPVPLGFDMLDVLFVVSYDLSCTATALQRLASEFPNVPRIPIVHHLGIENVAQTLQCPVPLPQSWQLFCGQTVDWTDVIPLIQTEQTQLDIFHRLSPWDIRVVFLGTRPFRTNFTGIAFSASSSKSTTMQNIQHALKQNGFDGAVDVSKWIQQGVFLLNAEWSLSFSSAPKRNSPWHFVTATILGQLVRRFPGLIIVAWGHIPKQVVSLAIPPQFPLVKILRNNDPGSTDAWSSSEFQTINALLVQQGQQPIQWTA